MKIKRTTAPDMRTAMKIIRDEQGPDAVILGNRKVAGGVEIVSAIDYEAGAVDSRNLFGDAVPQAPAPVAAPAPTRVMEAASAPAIPEHLHERVAAASQERWDAHNKDDLNEAERSVRRATELLRAARAAGKQNTRPAEPAPERRVAPRPQPAARVERTPEPSYAEVSFEAVPPPVAQRAVEPRRERPVERAQAALQTETSHTQMKAMQGELQAMRELMSQQLNVMGWGNMTRRQPARVNLLTRLHHMGIGTELALKLCEGVDSATDPSRNWRDALAMLQAQIPESREDMIEHGGVFALMGTTGVGKTTAIAKLAALCAMRHGKHSVALISTDNMRVGAREQLRSFAAILDVPLMFSENAEQLEREVQRMRERKLVLVDTAGLGVNDPRMGQTLAQIRRVKAIQPILTLAANAQQGSLEQTCRVFGNCDPVGCIVTKVDEAHTLGAVMTSVVEHKIPLTWFGTGQRVPEDLTRASAAGMMRLALGTEALRKPALLDADELASHYGSAGNTADA